MFQNDYRREMDGLRPSPAAVRPAAPASSAALRARSCFMVSTPR